ncbi:hypothetical protein NQ315_004595 [Exocentrus adspersus]|uniref:Uncharacterized protein n=1 Tax=Exocentrus adspersus TaxID=1586481 RepID=A0AAV8VN72_9CUCU|nr:hypothetical protein NQ315_004595 [Exocentrus adspersus]
MESLEEVAAREEAERQQSLKDLEQLYEWLQQFEDPPPAPRPPPPFQFRSGLYSSNPGRVTKLAHIEVRVKLVPSIDLLKIVKYKQEIKYNQLQTIQKSKGCQVYTAHLPIANTA